MNDFREFSMQYNDWLMHADHGNTTKASKKYFSNNEPPSHVAYQLAKAGMTVEQVGEYCERMELASGLGSGSRKYYNEVFKIFKENYASHSNIGNDFREFSELYHHGILGMHWGIRRYQNPDGTLTEAGKARYDKYMDKANSHLKESEKHHIAFTKDNHVNWKDKETKDHYKNVRQWVKNRDKAIKYGTETSEEKEKRLELEKIKKEAHDKFLKSIPDTSLEQALKDNNKLLQNKKGERADEAADLGIKAYKRLGRDMGDTEPGDEGSRDWFKYEDQTIGDMEVADLCKQTGSKEETIRILKGISDHINQFDSEATWDLDYFYKNCIKSDFSYKYNNQSTQTVGEDYIDAIFAILQAEGKIQHSVADAIFEKFGIV